MSYANCLRFHRIGDFFFSQTKLKSSALGLALNRNGCGEQEPPVVGDWTEWEGCSGESLGTKMAKCWAEGFQAATKEGEKVFGIFGIVDFGCSATES